MTTPSVTLAVLFAVCSAACAGPSENAAREQAVSPPPTQGPPAEAPPQWATPPADGSPSSPAVVAAPPAPEPVPQSGCRQIWQGQEVNCCVKHAMQHCDPERCAADGGRCEPGACGSSHCARELVAPSPPSPPPPPPIPGAGASHCAGPPPSPSHVCVRDCPPPVGRAGDPEPGWSWLSAELAENRRRFGCPICLPHDARIATPSGSVAISALTPGTAVWTLDASGRRARTRVSVVLSTPAPSGHRLAVIELSDGRTLRASPGHPDARGRAVGVLQPGDRLDQSVVRAVHLEGYTGRTFDLVLQDGRHYWADGVLLESSVVATPSGE